MLTLSYVGGGSFSNDGSVSNGVIQGLNFSERLSYRRYVLSFFDQLHVCASDGVWGSRNSQRSDFARRWNAGFGNGYTPGQSILTARGQRLTNFSGGEVDVLLTPTDLADVCGRILTAG